MLSLVIRKLKAFRPTVPSMILLILASYRTICSGASIQLVGVCAAIVPFICQFRNFSVDADAPALKDVISSYILNLILMVLYLAWVLLLTWMGKTFNPNYIPNPHFTEMLFIAVAADVVFITDQYSGDCYGLLRSGYGTDLQYDLCGVCRKEKEVTDGPWEFLTGCKT